MQGVEGVVKIVEVSLARVPEGVEMEGAVLLVATQTPVEEGEAQTVEVQVVQAVLVLS